MCQITLSKKTEKVFFYVCIKKKVTVVTKVTVVRVVKKIAQPLKNKSLNYSHKIFVAQF